MTRIRISTSDAVRCAKRECKSSEIHRHHIRHQHLFVKAFFYSHPEKEEGGEKYDRFKRRYEEFRDSDIVYLCASHHAEIHYIYDPLIWDEVDRLGRPLRDFTWAEAEALMDSLAEAYEKWIVKKTRGRSPKRRWKKWYRDRKKKG